MLANPKLFWPLFAIYAIPLLVVSLGFLGSIVFGRSSPMDGFALLLLLALHVPLAVGTYLYLRCPSSVAQWAGLGLVGFPAIYLVVSPFVRAGWSVFRDGAEILQIQAERRATAFPDETSRALEEAIGRQDVEAIQRLASPGAVNAISADGRSLLSDALSYANAEHDMVAIVRLLLERGANPNARLKTRGVLALSVDSPQDELLRLLLQHGADPNMTDADGNPYLRQVFVDDNPTRLKLFLDAGADVNRRGRFGQTPLIQAIAYGAWKCALVLVERGADLNTRDDDGQGVAESVKSRVEWQKGVGSENRPVDAQPFTAFLDLLRERGITVPELVLP